MSEYIVGNTANDVWKKATNMLLEQKDKINGRSGDVYELLHTFITIKSPRQKWIYDRIPPLSIGFALAELIWILNGDDRSDIINFWNPSLHKFAGDEGFYYGAYGKRIRSHFKFDQLEKTYYALQNVPESRQVVIQIYDVKKDFPIYDGQPRNMDIPCNVCSMLKIREGKLEWSQIMRSNDVLLGMPYNFVQFTGLQEIMAGWLDLEVGSYNHYSDSLHIYCRDIDSVKIDNEDKIENQDSLSLCKVESEQIIKEIYKRMMFFALNKTTENELHALAHLDSDYKAYNNIMLIIAAYVARKKQNNDLVTDLIEECTNVIYKKLWGRWIEKNNYT